jgi:hypothetical protein
MVLVVVLVMLARIHQLRVSTVVLRTQVDRITLLAVAVVLEQLVVVQVNFLQEMVDQEPTVSLVGQLQLLVVLVGFTLAAVAVVVCLVILHQVVLAAAVIVALMVLLVLQIQVAVAVETHKIATKVVLEVLVVLE